MRLGVHVASFTWPGGPAAIGPTLADIARAVEDGGGSSLTVMDHYFQMDQFAPAEEPMLEGYTTLGFLAAVTSRVELGLLVTGVTYRYPGLLAKIVTTLDVLSGGRGRLGIGAAWYEREHVGLGVPFPPVAERFERLEETLRICRQMWSGEGGTFEGRHYRLAEALSSPESVSRPRPRIMVGGAGERKTLRLVARYADACNLFAASPDEVRHKLDVLRDHCDAEGTDYDHIDKTILHVGAPPIGSGAGPFLDAMASYAEHGVGEVYVMPTGDDPVGYVRALGDEVVEPLAAL